jgi:hypothetical protein
MFAEHTDPGERTRRWRETIAAQSPEEIKYFSDELDRRIHERSAKTAETQRLALEKLEKEKVDEDRKERERLEFNGQLRLKYKTLLDKESEFREQIDMLKKALETIEGAKTDVGREIEEVARQMDKAGV